VLGSIGSGPNTNGSQFFITLAPTQWLDGTVVIDTLVYMSHVCSLHVPALGLSTGKHTIFGRVYSGLSVVRRMGLVETNKDDRFVSAELTFGETIVTDAGVSLRLP
jgi:peptidyl-prolyl cis-trans isomerase-like 1